MSDPASFGRLPEPPPRALYRYRGWRRFRSMRTALILLGVLALAAALAGLVPQEPNVPEAADRFLRTVPWLRAVCETLGLFDVYGSWWFQGVLALLVIVLVACLLPRTGALIRHQRTIGRPPEHARFPSMARRTEMATALAPDVALDRVRRVLARKAYRLSAGNAQGQFVAERGFAREAGSLLFHWSLLLVIAGAAVSVGFGFRGQAIIVEGTRWVEDEATYSFAAPGRFFPGHKGFALDVDRFDVAYRDDGAPADFVTSVGVVEDGRQVKHKLIRVNDPLVHGGFKFYQASYGWAPVVRVAAGDEVLYEGPVVTFAGGPGGSTEGVVRLPSRSPQMALVLEFYPDPIFAPAGIPGLPPPGPGEGDRRLVNLSDVPGASVNRSFGNTRPLGIPVLVVQAYEGDLQSNRPQNVYSIDVDDLGLRRIGGDLLVPAEAEQATGALLQNTSMPLGSGVTVQLLEMRRYTVLSVKSDPGLPVVGLAAALVMVGLIPSLLSWRRRLWVHVSPREEGEGSLVELGGLAYQRKERFGDEFTSITLRLREQLPPPVPERTPVS